MVQKYANPVEPGKCTKMLKNAPSLAIRNVDTAENGPSKVCCIGYGLETKGYVEGVSRNSRSGEGIVWF